MNYDITSILYDDTFREYSSDYNIKCDYIDIDSLFNKGGRRMCHFLKPKPKVNKGTHLKKELQV